MPFYDLKCTGCGNVFNVKATISEKENKKIPCPNCGGKELVRVYDTMHLSVGNSKPERPASECACCSHAGGCPHARK